MLIADLHPVRVYSTIPVSTVTSSQTDRHDYIQYVQTHIKTQLMKTERQTDIFKTTVRNTNAFGK